MVSRHGRTRGVSRVFERGPNAAYAASPLEFPGSENVLMLHHIHTFTAEAHAFELKAQPLLVAGFEAQFDFPACTYDTLPG